MGFGKQIWLASTRLTGVSHYWGSRERRLNGWVPDLLRQYFIIYVEDKVQVKYYIAYCLQTQSAWETCSLRAGGAKAHNLKVASLKSQGKREMTSLSARRIVAWQGKGFTQIPLFRGEVLSWRRERLNKCLLLGPLCLNLRSGVTFSTTEMASLETYLKTRRQKTGWEGSFPAQRTIPSYRRCSLGLRSPLHEWAHASLMGSVSVI